jgi:hypothetical protein
MAVGLGEGEAVGAAEAVGVGETVVAGEGGSGGTAIGPGVHEAATTTAIASHLMRTMVAPRLSIG